MRRSIVLLSLLAAAPLAAQGARTSAGTPGAPSKQAMTESWIRTRDNMLRYVRVAPDSMLGFRATPGVRTFAEQVVHAVESDVEIVSMARGRPQPRPTGDAAARLRGKQALLEYVTWGYEQVSKLLAETPDARFATDTTLFGARRAMPRWRWLEGAREHDAFTLGQMVPYLRMNGVTPPEFREF